MISESIIQQVKEAANVVDVVADFYELRKAGNEYTCPCPLHGGRALRRFLVSPKRNIYKCFVCGEFGGAIDFLIKDRGLTFPDAVRWLAQKYNIETGEERKAWTIAPKPTAPRQAIPELPMLVLPVEIVLMRRDTQTNTLANWLRGLTWNAEQRGRVETVLRSYVLGTSKEGHAIYWQIDETGRVRTGKMMQYNADGHRNKARGSFDWIHSRLFKAGRYNEDEWQMQQCLFGLHLLDFARTNLANIVESEKTALICAIAYGLTGANGLWLATGGKSNLTREKLNPLIDRGYAIRLYPDHDAIEAWREQADIIAYPRLQVRADTVLRNWLPEDGDKADLGDIIVRMQSDPETHRAGPERIGQTMARLCDIRDKMCEANPNLRAMIDRLDLQIRQ